jgi:hypothetical protein
MVALISLKREAKIKGSKEIETEICRALEESLIRPRLVLKMLSLLKNENRV